VLKASNISKSYGDRRVLGDVSFVVNAGERLGTVAPNGAGKTTLLDILAGDLTADSGSVQSEPGARIGYVRQGFANVRSRPVSVVFSRAFAAVNSGARIEDAAAALATADDPVAVNDAQRGLDEALAAHVAESDIAQAWGELELRPIQPEETLAALSGGEQTKLALLEAFAAVPDILLLDEPTNNLDLNAAAWLDERLASFAGPAVIVSHDRALLDDHATSILQLDPRTVHAEIFAGNYTDYAAEKAQRHEAQWDAYRRQQDRERRVRREIHDIRSTASRREHLTQNDFYRRKAKKVARRAVVLERRLERELASEERTEKPFAREYTILPQVKPVARGGDRMLATDGLRLTVAGHLLIDGISLSVGWGERIVIIGPNGSGKTTLLCALVGEVPADEGVIKRSPSLKLGYLPQDDGAQAPPPAHAGDVAQSAPAVRARVAATATPLTTIRSATELSETEARRFLHRFLFEGDAVHTPVSQLSYGERRRLSLAGLVLAGANLLVLDEPTNHLDIPSREALEAALEAYEGAVLAVTHDRYFIDRFADRLFELRDGTLTEP
jgi:ATP-binding cassette subfamily F protein 3